MCRRGALIAFLALVVAALTALTGRADAFTVGSAFSDPCHESITLEAFEGRTPIPGGEAFTPKDDAVWLRVAEYLERSLELTLNNDAQRFLLVTVFIGVRHPDQLGFGITDLANIRNIHLDQEGQEFHALRSKDQNGVEGDAAAVAALRAYILATIEEAYAEFQADTFALQTAEVEFYLEYYGQIDVRVWKPGFLIGRALHALQDSFPHTYRSADATRIYAVGNYLEGLSNKHREPVDGPRHSSYLDECKTPEVIALVNAARMASEDLLDGIGAYFQTGDIATVEAALDAWITYQPGCDTTNDYCGTPWEDLAKLEETHAPLSCATAPARAGRWPTLASLALLLAALMWSLRDRRAPRPSGYRGRSSC